jgi:hypothetical protein
LPREPPPVDQSAAAGRRRVAAVSALLGGVVARTFGLRAPFLLAGVAVPVVALLCLPVVNRRSIAEARARAAG